MTDWINIHPDFTEELQAEWEGYGFDYDQVEMWIKEYGFSLYDAEFAIYLGDMNLIISDLESNELDKLRNDYNEAVRKNFAAFATKEPSLKRKSEEMVDPRDKRWKNVERGFTPELVQEWQIYGFDYEEIKDWISTGLKITDADFCAWLRDKKRVDNEWVLNCGDLEQLQSEYQQYLTSSQLSQQVQRPFTNY